MRIIICLVINLEGRLMILSQLIDIKIRSLINY